MSISRPETVALLERLTQEQRASLLDGLLARERERSRRDISTWLGLLEINLRIAGYRDLAERVVSMVTQETGRTS